MCDSRLTRGIVSAQDSEVTFTADFYRLRLEDKLALGFGDEVQHSGQLSASIHTEAALLAVADDVEFIRQAYRFYLKRDPDLGGFQHFCDVVEKSGRQPVLDGIRYSDEARQLALAGSSQPVTAAVAQAASHSEVASTPAVAGGLLRSVKRLLFGSRSSGTTR